MNRVVLGRNDPRVLQHQLHRRVVSQPAQSSPLHRLQVSRPAASVIESNQRPAREIISEDSAEIEVMRLQQRSLRHHELLLTQLGHGLIPSPTVSGLCSTAHLQGTSLRLRMGVGEIRCAYVLHFGEGDFVVMTADVERASA